MTRRRTGRALFLWLIIALAAGPLSCRDFSSSAEGGGGTGGIPSSGDNGSGSATDGRKAPDVAEVPASDGQAGEAGHAGQTSLARHTGQAGGSPQNAAGGVGGLASNDGGGSPVVDDGDPTDVSDEPVSLTSCTFSYPFNPTRSASLGISKTYSLLGPQVYSSDLGTQTMLVAWLSDFSNNKWTPWVCFDLAPSNARIAATNLPNGHPEIFATTTNGLLLVRHSGADGRWTPWLPFSPPKRDSFITDVTVVGGTLPAVYVIADGKVYVRRKIDVAPYSSYGPWQAIGLSSARLISATQSVKGETVFVLKDDDTIEAANATVVPDGTTYSDWTSIAKAPAGAVDLDAVATSSDVAVYALGNDGALLARDVQGSSTWRNLRTADELPRLVSLAAQVDTGDDVQLYGITGQGTLYESAGGEYWDVVTHSAP